MDPADFPLSAAYRAHAPLPLPPTLGVPPRGDRSPRRGRPRPHDGRGPGNGEGPLTILPAAALAIRKLVWRALLERALRDATPIDTPPSHTAKPKSQSATVPAHWPRRREQRAPFVIPGETSTIPEPPPRPAQQPQPTLELPDAQTGIGATPALTRLGRLRDAAYDTWDGFLAIAAARMGVRFPGGEDGNKSEEEEEEKSRPVFIWDIPGCAADKSTDANSKADAEAREDDATRTPDVNDNADDVEEEEDPLDTALLGALPPHLRARARELAALHVIRCLVGALVEDAVLRDRAAWVRGALGLPPSDDDDDDDEDDNDGEGNDDDVGGGRDGEGVEGKAGREKKLRVRLVNLFDQATGSGRNVALVIAPVAEKRARTVSFLGHD